MTRRDQIPVVGDYVECADEFKQNVTHTGTVEDILSTQFIYVDHMGVQRFSFFRNWWRLIK
jgi:hypothetical protein